MMDQIQALRVEIKDWEYQFFKTKGWKPLAEDIKQNAEIRQKYKEYNRYKRQQQANVTPKKEKKVSSVVQTTPQKQFLEKEVATPRNLGPTPQVSGRVMSIFDISPVKRSATGEVFRTPSKRKRLQLNDSPSKLTTPRKTPITRGPVLSETPLYLRQQSFSIQEELMAVSPEVVQSESPLKVNLSSQETPTKITDTFIEPSPVFDPVKLVKRKSLYEMSKDLEALQNEKLSIDGVDEDCLDEEVLKLMQGETEPNEEEVENGIDKATQLQVQEEPLHRKKATQKRTTRRAKIKVRKYHEKDEELDIEDITRKTDESNRQELVEETGDQELETGSETDDGDDDDEGNKSTVFNPPPGGYRKTRTKLVSTNFVKYKLKRRGKRRR
ncbi:BA75_04564T0 [Komagataella pastoris]|uniref:DNA replication regulator SLD2 n=1 Tax=Komagataella pastoris TaxID=4922 RepID=A0A1B2JJ99_PICPA|nr:BA75_04564T0 [Komagataella pastoris]